MNLSLLSSNVLVLNRNYLPVHVTTVRRAFILLYHEVAQVIDEQYQTYDYKSWSELSVEAHHESVGLVDKLIRVPRVILLTVYDRLPKKNVRFSRLNIYLRDNNTCQYCGKHFARYDLNLDHVVPRVKGGQTSWENVVCSCIECNRRKGGMSVAEAGMRLIRKPTKPHWNFMVDLPSRRVLYEAWKPFLNIVDFSYWNVEIEHDS